MTRALDGIAYRERSPAYGPAALVLHDSKRYGTELGAFRRSIG